MKDLRISRYVWLTLWLLMGSWQHSWAQDLFEEDEPLSMILKADWLSFLADRGDSADYYPATIQYLENQEAKSMPLRIRVRGNFRRKASICSIPPIRLRFRRTHREGSIFHPHKKLKLVSSCQGDLYVIREYLAYKLYQLISPASYQVRLVRMTMQDSDPLQPTEQHLSFVIEDEDHLAGRLSRELVEHVHPAENMLSQPELVRIALFHFLIGNMDWDVPMEKNLSFLRNGMEPLVPVPYDFDWSGIVNAPYTMLPEDFERRQARQVCKDPDMVQRVLDEVLAQEEAIDQFLKEFSHLDKAERRLLRQYCRTSFRQMRKADFATQFVTQTEAEAPAP